jgi:AraC-like DNA-binding protein
MSNSTSFSHDFISALKSSSKLSVSTTFESFLPPSFRNENSLYPHYLSLLAGGKISATYPYLYDMELLDAYCILYTEEGSGYLRYENRTFYLDPCSLVFFDCRKLHHIEIQHSPWKFKVLYIKGSSLAHYFKIYSQNKDVIIFLGKSNYLPGLIDRIINMDSANEYYLLIQNRILTDFLTELTIEKRHGFLPQSEVRSHVLEMKYMFDSHCEFHYTLEWLEDHFQISRYRLCREFKEAEATSPIAYLNTVRMNMAKHLLISTNLRINEIASSVGVDNTNHFIKLFKASTGTTPSNYRK